MPATPTIRRRRTPIVVVVLVVVGVLVAVRLRTRATPALRADPPTWPPLPPRPAQQRGAATDAAAESPAGLPAEIPADTTTVSATANAAPVVAEPDTAWAPPDDDGSCPIGFPIKVKATSGIYHLPSGRFYDRTHADRCYADEAAAAADGYRRSKT